MVSGIRVLYVCPLAHVDGHPFHAAINETRALVEAGVQVTLLTFAGLAENRLDNRVRHISLIPPGKGKRPRQSRPLGPLRRATTFFLTISKAALLNAKEDYDVIHLRDATGPFMFLPQLLGILSRGERWCLSLLLTEQYPSLAGAAVQATKSESLYRLSFRLSRYVYVCQNSELVSYYSKSFLDGILDKRVFLLPLMIGSRPSIDQKVPRASARLTLGIPDDGPILLSFGALHPGKDFGVVMDSLRELPGVTIVQAGNTNGTLKGDPRAELPNLMIDDDFVSEEKKALYFAASSAIVLSYRKSFTGTASMLWEACKFGIPVIASSNRELEELVSAYRLGILFEPGNPISLTNAITQFLKLGAEELAQIQQGCQRFREDFSDQAWAEKCIGIYSVVSDKAG